MNHPLVGRLAWHRVPEVWLFILLIVATVVGTFVMMTMAIQQPDAHLIVPDDVARPSRIPPTSPAAVVAPAPAPADHPR